MAENNGQEQNKKKRGGFPVVLLLLIIIIAALLLLMNYLGLGFGGGKGSGGDDNASAVSSEERKPEDETTTEEQIKYIEVKVSGDKFSVDGEETDIKDIVGAVKGKGDNIIVNIVDDGAVNDSMEALRDALSEGGVKFVDPEVE
ncbi:MAG: hypothetical protein IKQ90_01960 [Ruminococcus sp.]|nr:hypothetical protein [Ruminococcus sp.]